MSSSNAKPFDPLILDRTVIALPLLRAMQEDLERCGTIRDKHPEEVRRFNSAIEYNKSFPGGEREAYRLVSETLIEEAIGRQPEALREAIGRQHEALREAIGRQSVQPITPWESYSFAQLHAAVIRRLLAANERISASPALRPIARVLPARFEIIIDLNLEHPRGREAARQWVLDHIKAAKRLARIDDAGQEVLLEKDQRESQYVFARLEAAAIRKLVELDIAEAGQNKFRSIHHIWPDFEISACINKSIATVKSDAAQNSFSADGAGITWAVMDSGIQHGHEHFRRHANIDPASPLHRDFTVDGGGPLNDENGHGTHVAGIIAGEWPPETSEARRPVAVLRHLKADAGDVEYQATRLDSIRGMAPKCRLVSLRVLDENGKGSVSNLIAAIGHVQEKNGYGRRLVIHGVNMSLGYNFEPEWFACGQSPLCVEVDRLVKSGVVVVVAAGNTGYGTLKSAAGAGSAGMALTINDPGNSDLAITVGATHRDMPHVYGVSYFSSKGPTGDGRMKPDLVAPGEKIISCAAGNLKKEGAKERECDYVESSGTSTAAPHVSGVIAAFLSVRGEFIGKPERVKEIFLSTATDLRRDRYFQGAGLVDLMRAIQSV